MIVHRQMVWPIVLIGAALIGAAYFFNERGAYRGSLPIAAESIHQPAPYEEPKPAEQPLNDGQCQDGAKLCLIVSYDPPSQTASDHIKQKITTSFVLINPDGTRKQIASRVEGYQWNNDTGYAPLPDVPYAATWEQADWSADGKTLYFLRSTGLPIDGPGVREAVDIWKLDIGSGALSQVVAVADINDLESHTYIKAADVLHSRMIVQTLSKDFSHSAYSIVGFDGKTMTEIPDMPFEVAPVSAMTDLDFYSFTPDENSVLIRINREINATDEITYRPVLFNIAKGTFSFPENWKAINSIQVAAASGEFIFTHLCNGDRVDLQQGKFHVCVGMNRLQISHQGKEYIVDEREGKALPSDDGGETRLFSAPALMWAKPLFYDPALYPKDYLPDDMVISYDTDPAFDGTGGVGSVSEPPSYLTLGKNFDGKGSMRVMRNYPFYNPPVFGPAGKGVWIDGPVCSGAACTMEPSPMQVYDVLADTSTVLGTQEATLEYAAYDWDHPDQKYRIWGDISWKDLHTVEANIIEPDGTTTTFREMVK